MIITGFTCQIGKINSPAVHIYFSDANSKKLVAKGVASFIADDATNKKCGSSGKFIFKVAIPLSVAKLHIGKKISAYGINLISGHRNPLLENSEKHMVTHLGCGVSAQTGLGSDRSAYHTGFQQGQGDDWYYAAWNWRESHLVETNHSVSIMRSRDLKNWENLCGERLTLPVSVNSKTVVDPVLMGGGLLNGLKLGFDKNKRPVITYQKYKTVYSVDAKPIVTTQVYNARFVESEGRFRIHQMTNWTTKMELLGGGAIPSDDFSIGYSKVQVLNDKLVQSFSRAKADKTGYPHGSLVISDTNDALMITSEKAPANSDPFYRTFNKDSGPNSAAGKKLELRSFVADPTPVFEKKERAARFDEQWVMLRGDWDAEGHNRGGLFNRLNRKFVIRRADGDRNFYFGPSTIPLRPLVGDWDNDGHATVGVESKDGARYFKNSLTAGQGDVVSGTPRPGDGTSVWHTVNPQSKYILKYEGLKSNRDYAYDCSGTQLKVIQSNDTFGCKEKFLADLTLWEYSETDSTWKSNVIDRMWAGSEAKIDFLVFKSFLIVAYYNQDRKLTVAMRTTNGKQWSIKPLDSDFLGWDAHNDITLDVDENHDVHISGNMHVHKLNYWRMSGFNINSIQRIFPMVNSSDEEKVTYPTFSRDPNGNLLFSYRKGGSGNGVWIYNKYDSRTKKWDRFLDRPLFGN